MLCGLRVDGKVKGKRSVNDTACDFAFLAHLCQLRRLHCDSHLGIHYFYCRQGRYLGHVHAAGIAYRNSVLDNVHLILQCRISHKCHVGEEQEPVIAFHLEYRHMGKRIAGAQAYFLVQDALQEILGIDQAFHIHIRFSVVSQLHGFQRCRNHIRLVNYLISIQIHADGSGHFPDLFLVSYQDRIRNASLFGFLHGFQHCGILRHGYGHCLLPALLYPCHDIIKTLLHFCTYILSAFPALCFLEIVVFS